MTVEDQLVLHEVLGIAVWSCTGLLYADDGMVGSREMECL